MQNISITKISILDFKRIEKFDLELSKITALVGGNTSGKSSILQATQLCISLLQAAYKGRDKQRKPIFINSVSNNEVAFRPTENLLDLRRGSSATQAEGYKISISASVSNENEFNPKDMTFNLIIKRGKNANLSLKIENDIELAALLAENKFGSSVFTPGLSGISTREELRTKGALASSVMQGDANTYIRSLLYHLFHEGKISLKNNDRKTSFNETHIHLLPESNWKSFCILLDEIYKDARVKVYHDPNKDRYLKIILQYNEQEVPLDLASTGMLQVIQILAYACYFTPPLLLLDEPDAHLHADSQGKLFEAIIRVTGKTKILLTSHSPQLLHKIHKRSDVTICWMDKGKKVDLTHQNLPAIPLLMEIGALGLGSELFDTSRKVILLTEDSDTKLVRIMAEANGAPDNLTILSYSGCNNLQAARKLALLIKELRQDVKIVIHRDRDFRTEQEMSFEKIRFNRWLSNESGENITEIFTTLNDIEHAFCNIEHLKTCFTPSGTCTLEFILETAIKIRRDDFVQRLTQARNTIKLSLYESTRLKNDSAWKTAGMPDSFQGTKGFLPTDSTQPFPFSSCHGKTLEKEIRTQISRNLILTPREIENKLYTKTDKLIDPLWMSVFN